MSGISELRQDLVTGDWVVVATGRARRPHEFAKHRIAEKPQPRASCPFERLLPGALLVYDRKGATPHGTRGNASARQDRWWVQVLPNKYPAFSPSDSCPIPRPVGPYHWQEGVGFHEVVVTRHHTRALGAMTGEEVGVVLRAYRDRYLALRGEPCVRYVSIFENHGRAAGATISHHHSQIIAIRLIPPDVERSLRGSAAYFKKRRSCVHCTMMAFERRQGWRVVYENKACLVFCPYVSRQAFEVRIFPKRHQPAFESVSEDELHATADALQAALAKLNRGLGDPAYNFFIHTAPTTGSTAASYYHWHIEIIPKTAVWAGFEIGTGIEISTSSPEAAAQFLRKINA